MAKPDDFLTGKLPPEDADIASFAFVGALMKNSPKQFDAMLDGLRAGEDFDRLFLATYKGTPAQAAGFWVKSVGR